MKLTLTQAQQRCIDRVLQAPPGRRRRVMNSAQQRWRELDASRGVVMLKLEENSDD